MKELKLQLVMNHTMAERFCRGVGWSDLRIIHASGAGHYRLTVALPETRSPRLCRTRSAYADRDLRQPAQAGFVTPSGGFVILRLCQPSMIHGRRVTARSTGYEPVSYTHLRAH